MRNRREKVDEPSILTSLKGKLTLFGGSTLIVLAFIFAWSIIYNASINKSDKLHQLAKELNSSVSTIENKLQASFQNQQSYLATDNVIYRLRWIKLWAGDIEPELQRLEKLAIYENKKTNKLLKKAIKETYSFKSTQESIDRRYTYSISQNAGSFTSERILFYMQDLIIKQQKVIKEWKEVKESDAFAVDQHIVTMANATKSNLVTLTGCLIAAIIVISMLIIFPKYIQDSLQKSQVLVKTKQTDEETPVEKHSKTPEVLEVMTALDMLSSNLKTVCQLALKVNHIRHKKHLDENRSIEKLQNDLSDMRGGLEKVTLYEPDEKIDGQGVSKISEILQSENFELDAYYYKLLSFLIKYLGGQHGGIFLIDKDKDSNEYLQMVAGYADGQRKVVEKRVAIREGVVGQAFFEKEEIYLTDIPDNYIDISSGFSKNPPRCVLASPLIVNGKIEGIIEIAGPDSFSKNQIDFVRKTGGLIASSIASFKLNAYTVQLLETSENISEELETQNEILKQNLEEIQTEKLRLSHTDEASVLSKEAADMNKLAFAEFDPDGNIINCNQAFTKLMGYEFNDELIGQHHKTLVSDKYANSNEYVDFWSNLRSGKISSGKFHRLNKKGEEVIILGAYSVNRNIHNKPLSIKKFAIDISKSFKASRACEEKIQALDSSGIGWAEFSPEGEVLNSNTTFIQMMRFNSIEEVVGKHHSIFLDPEYAASENYRSFWNKIKNGTPAFSTHQRITNDGKIINISSTYSAIKNEQGKTEKIIKFTIERGVRNKQTQSSNTKTA